MASPEEELNELVKTCRKAESFGCKYDCDERRSKEDELILRQSLERTTCKVDGRYQVGRIWRDSNSDLPDNRAVAEKRLRLLEKRLKLNAKYRQTIDDDLQKGHIKKLSEQELSEPATCAWYLPHHPVPHPQKSGKVRRDSDAAAKYQGTSLMTICPLGLTF